jgi:hypothetical protein
VLVSLSLLGATIALTGCGFTTDKILSVAPAGKGTHGRVIGGQAPVVGAVVSVYAVGIGGPPTLLASTLSDGLGNFAFNTDSSNTYACAAVIPPLTPSAIPQSGRPHPQAASAESTIQVKTSSSAVRSSRARPADLPDQTDTYVYITAIGGNAGGGLNTRIALGAGLGKCSDAQNETVEINEVSTVVLANVMGNFGDGAGDMVFGTGTDPHQINAMEIALTNTFQTIDDLATGTVKPNTVSTTGGTSITIEAAKIYSIANTIASCVNSADVITPTPGPSAACQTLFADSTYFGAPSFDTFSAATNICYAPYTNVAALYMLAGPEAPFVGLPSAPNDWTVAISYSTTAMGLALYESTTGGGTSSTIDLDSSSRVWFPSNKTGAAGIGYFDPTENTFNGPFGGGAPTARLGFPLTVPQYVALDDPSQIAWATDTQTGALVGVDTTPGSEGNVLHSDSFSNSGGSFPVSTGPLFVNSDESVVLNYDNTFGTPLQLTFDPFTRAILGQSVFTLQPTGLTLDTTDGSDPNDVALPGMVAATSDLSTACNLEFSSVKDGNSVKIGNASDFCLSGGAATAEYDAASGKQDEVGAFTALNAYCSAILAACDSPAGLNGPEGVSIDGGGEVWFANSGNASIYPLVITYKGGVAYSPLSDIDYLHDAVDGNTMTQPIGIAVDRGGNIWVSNANCTGSADTTCAFTLSEVFGTAFATFTPLSVQAARLQGTQPTQGSFNVMDSPSAMLRGKPARSHASVLRK